MTPDAVMLEFAVGERSIWKGGSLINEIEIASGVKESRNDEVIGNSELIANSRYHAGVRGRQTKHLAGRSRTSNTGFLKETPSVGRTGA
jgi:hypothetical protein